MKKHNLKGILFYAVMIVVTVIVILFVMNSLKDEAKTTSDLIDMFANGEVASYKWDQYQHKLTVKNDAGNEIVFEAIDNDTYRQQILPSVESINATVDRIKDLTPVDGKYYDEEGNEIKVLRAEKITFDHKKQQSMPIWVSFIPYLILIVAIIAIVVFARKQGGGGDSARGFGKARPKLGSDEKEKTYFKDVAGCDEEKEELTEIVEFLRDPGKFTKLGAKIPHGVLLVGPPGTGKTLLAKAVAGEAGVPFYSISGSDFVEMYVGVGASRVRSLFETARKNPASIIFIDEIDAVGRHRGAGLGGGHDEREQTLNQLLVEMDGFGGNSGTIVMAATNRPDILDPALLRPGRFDRQVTVNYPNQKGREEILHVHARKKPLEKTVDLGKIAQMTTGFTGADLANVLNEAALSAAKKGKDLIGMNDIEEAVLKEMVGSKKKSNKMNEKDKKNTAYHEAGHAVVCFYLPHQDPVRHITIVPTSKGALGYMLSHPTEDTNSKYLSEMKEDIAVSLAGRVTEEILHEGDYTSGASSDIQHATAVARNMVTRYGMSELGPILYGSEHGADEVFLGRDFSSEKTYSEETASQIDLAIKRIIDEAYATAKKIITEHYDKLTFIAEYLVKYEEMEGDQFKAAMEAEAPSEEEIYAMAEERRRVSEQENEEKRRIEEEERKKREEELMRDPAYRQKMQDVNEDHVGENEGSEQSEQSDESSNDNSQSDGQ